MGLHGTSLLSSSVRPNFCSIFSSPAVSQWVGVTGGPTDNGKKGNGLRGG